MIIPGGTLARRRTAWPLASALPPMGALTSLPSVARAHVAVTLTGWRLSALAHTAELVASELCTNAIEASTGSGGHLAYVNGRMPVVLLRLFSDGTRLVIECADQAPGIPVIHEADPGAKAGAAWSWSPH